MHQTCEKNSLLMTYKLDGMIELPKSQPKKTYKEDLECEMGMVKIPRCMQWLDTYDEPIRDLDMMVDKVNNPSTKSTPQLLPSFEEYTPPVTCPKEVEETLETPMEVEPLDQTKIDDVGLDICNHDIHVSSREVLSFDEPKPQPQPLPSCPSLDESPGEGRSHDPPPKCNTPKNHNAVEYHLGLVLRELYPISNIKGGEELVADVGKLWNEYYKLELSMVRCFSLGGAAARTRDKRKMWLDLWPRNGIKLASVDEFARSFQWFHELFMVLKILSMATNRVSLDCGTFYQNPGFPAQSIISSNAIALDSPYLLVLITETSQSRQHGKSESDSYYLSDLSRQFIYWTKIDIQLTQA
nr:ribonuclease H-like domain-containing protein [Tanacetum cinerariifolium]